MKTVKIPECMNPFEVIVNNQRYRYPGGTEQEVPDEVAEVIEVHMKNHEERTAPPYVPGGGGGGATCKLKLTIDGDGDTMAYGHMVLFDDEITTIYFGNMGIGETAEYEIPCGSAIVKSCDFGATVSNLTEIPVGGDGTVFVYAAPNEPNAVATMRVYFGW